MTPAIYDSVPDNTLEAYIFDGMQPINFSITSILAQFEITALNAMQLAAIEAYDQHPNVLLLSPTGSGKTLAFLLPIVKNLQPVNPNTQALIVVPSRELAQQIETVFKKMGTGYKITSCYGGHKRETEENNLLQPPAVIVGTPGRIGDHIRRGSITVDAITALVLDEFDKSLELGFQTELAFIVESLKNVGQHLLTSATEAVDIPSFLPLNQLHRLHFLSENQIESGKLIVQKVISSSKDKVDTLFQLICHIGNRPTIVFCNHRESVERVSAALKKLDISNEYYHGALEQQERDSALCKFRNGTTNTLITTDLAARGLDIEGIRFIVHYHLPPTIEIYTHRNGRTARMEKSGTVILLVSEAETIPPYIVDEPELLTLPEKISLPNKPVWSTLFIAAGKKDKVNKIDIVGFCAKKGMLDKEDIGQIEVKDFFSFVAIKKNKVNSLLLKIKDEKIKNKKVKIDVAK